MEENLMAYIRSLKNGSFQATVRLKGITQYKTLPTKKAATAWTKALEKNIKRIPTLNNEQTCALSDDDIEAMGGNDLFLKLGVDVFKIRNAEKLEAIYQLSKKELLQLTQQQIENMGGSELFNQADKRIRYKTFRSVCGDYLEQWQGKDYTNQLSRVNYWCSVFGGRIITDIDVFDIRDQVDSMFADGQRATTINRKKAVLSSIFKYALSQGHIDENVIRNIVIDNDSKQRDRVLSNDERGALLAACKQSQWDKLHLLVLMAMTTGARKGELLGLRWNDIDFRNSTALLTDTKNGSSRNLTFPLIVMAEFKRFQEVGNGFIFESDRKPGISKDIRKAWATALRVAGISDKGDDKFTFHCLRHGFCSALSDSGKELSEIAEMAGHKSIQTTMRYVHQSNDRKKAIVDELAQAFNL
jgi:integrase